jgi:Ca-activated chloride channel family protein
MAIVLAAAGGIGLAAQEPLPTPTFKASVDVVPIRAVVRDQRGRVITGLKAADFQVLDKGRPAPIVDFQNDRESPVTIAVLVDTSGSMSMGPRVAFAAEMLKHLGAGLDGRRDEVGLFTFDATLREQQPFSGQTAAIETTITQAQPFGTTSLYDAIGETARRLSARPALRRALVVVTDGVDNGSARTPAEVSALASSLDVPVYVIATVQPIDREHYLQQEAVDPAPATGTLRDLAAWTGGDLLFVSGEQDAALRARELLTELRQQYVLAIEASTEADWRPVDIRMRNRNLVVRARSGYFGRPSALSR